MPRVVAQMRIERFDAVLEIVRRNAAIALAAQSSARIVEAKPDGPVSSVDLEIQIRLIDELEALCPGSRSVAEEMSKTAGSAPAGLSWIIDPIDGTSPYLAGEPDFGVQVAAAIDGRLVGGWIVCPALGREAAAWEGDGIDSSPPASPAGPDLRAVVASGDFDEVHRAKIRGRTGLLHRGTFSCAVDYLDAIDGRLDALVYRRTLPWDHAAGAYLASRAGLSVERWGGAPYAPWSPGEGILVSNPVMIARARDLLLPPAGES